MRRCFINKNFGSPALALIDTANDIIEEWVSQGYDLTLRQLYYQFVSRDLIPNTERSYKRIGSILTDARLAGMVDWDAITDRTRTSKSVPTYDTPKEFLEGLVYRYSQNHWDKQAVYIEVWVEKEALSQIIGRAANHYYAPHLACKGYVSASAMYDASRRFHAAGAGGKDCHLLYLGDHDPSGIDMTRDIRTRLQLFTEHMPLEVHRLALNMDQIEQYNPPPNPTKLTDSRAGGYIADFGHESWELDALEPSVINDLITDEIEELIDTDIFEESQRQETEYQNRIREFAGQFDEG